MKTQSTLGFDLVCLNSNVGILHASQSMTPKKHIQGHPKQSKFGLRNKEQMRNLVYPSTLQSWHLMNIGLDNQTMPVY